MAAATFRPRARRPSLMYSLIRFGNQPIPLYHAVSPDSTSSGQVTSGKSGISGHTSFDKSGQSGISGHTHSCAKFNRFGVSCETLMPTSPLTMVAASVIVVIDNSLQLPLTTYLVE